MDTYFSEDQGLGSLFTRICFPRLFGFGFCLQAPSVVRRMYTNKQKRACEKVTMRDTEEGANVGYHKG